MAEERQYKVKVNKGSEHLTEIAVGMNVIKLDGSKELSVPQSLVSQMLATGHFALNEAIDPLPTFEELNSDLPDDFPNRDILMESGITRLNQLQGMKAQDIQGLKGIGKAGAETISKTAATSLQGQESGAIQQTPFVGIDTPSASSKSGVGTVPATSSAGGKGSSKTSTTTSASTSGTKGVK